MRGSLVAKVSHNLGRLSELTCESFEDVCYLLQVLLWCVVYFDIVFDHSEVVLVTPKANPVLDECGIGVRAARLQLYCECLCVVLLFFPM